MHMLIMYGPQISYNPSGITRFLDTFITIKDNYAVGNEVAECNIIEIGGFTTIIHNSTSNSAFWFRNLEPKFIILRDSKVYFTSSNRELFYGVNNLEFTICKNSYFYVTSYNGLAYSTYGTSNTLIEENALLEIKKTNYSGSYATWYSYGTITLNKHSTLIIINNYEKISNSNYNIFFKGTNSGLILNNPYKVILYNSSANIVSTEKTSEFNFTYNRINLFDEAININDDISKDTCPTYSWYKTIDLSYVSGSFTSATTTVEDNNYTNEEISTLPDLENFNIVNKKILSIGTFTFHVDSITNKDTQIKGISDIYSSILIEYDGLSEIIQADENGNFSYSYSNFLPAGTQITFTAKQYEDLLYYTKKVEIVYSGELIIDKVTKNFQFEIYAIKKSPIICPRLTDLSVVVIDSRINSSDWKLYASINHDLKSSDGDILKNSLVFVDEIGNINVLSSTPTLIYTGKNNQGSISTTKISWKEDEGILL